MSPAAAEARVRQEDEQAEALRQRQMMLARRGRSVGEAQGEGATWTPGQAVAREPTPEEMEAARRRNEQREADAYYEMLQRDREELQRAPNVVSAVGEDVLTYSLGPLGAFGYNLAKEGIRGGPPSSPDLVTDFIASSGGELPPLVEATGRAGVYSLMPGSSTANAIYGTYQQFRNAEPPRGPSVAEAYQAHRREIEARAREEANRHPSGEQPRTEAPRQPISFEEIDEHGGMEAARQWRRKGGYELKAIENRLRLHTGVDGANLPKEEIAAIMGTLKLEEGAKVGRGVSRRELHALIDMVGPNKAVGQMDAAAIPVSEIEAILQEHGDPAWGYGSISDRMIKGLVGSVRERRRPKIPYGPDPYQRHV
jgi:hypothetical protein